MRPFRSNICKKPLKKKKTALPAELQQLFHCTPTIFAYACTHTILSRWCCQKFLRFAHLALKTHPLGGVSPQIRVPELRQDASFLQGSRVHFEGFKVRWHLCF